jgi:hypothetical protein
VYEVSLPRLDVSSVKNRQELDDDMRRLQGDANQAALSGDRAVLADRLSQIADGVLRAERMQFKTVQQLCGQIVVLRKGLDEAIARGRASILDVDATHQHVHILQSLTESELRDQLSADKARDDDDERGMNANASVGHGNASPATSMVHKQVCMWLYWYVIIFDCCDQSAQEPNCHS